MNFDFMFFANTILLGIGLSMDAFSVSLVNGLNAPQIKPAKMCGIAGVFGIFQALMPMIGWICVSTIAQYFKIFEKFIPWIALIILCFIGGKMIYESVKNKTEDDKDETKSSVSFGALLIQGVATSIDALSVGFTIAKYTVWEALLSCTLIGIITFGLCILGIAIGKKAGTHLSNKATIIGGIILILIGLEIFITSWF